MMERQSGRLEVISNSTTVSLLSLIHISWEYYIDEPEKLRGHWAEQFARRQPMVLELGCGKGGFLAQMAPAHPEKNYIALDVKSEMLVLAKRKAEEAYAAAGVPMDNFLMTAVDIERIFLIMDEDVYKRQALPRRTAIPWRS